MSDELHVTVLFLVLAGRTVAFIERVSPNDINSMLLSERNMLSALSSSEKFAQETVESIVDSMTAKSKNLLKLIMCISVIFVALWNLIKSHNNMITYFIYLRKR